MMPEGLLSSFKEGYDLVTGLADERAYRDAGGLIGQGDLTGAAGIIGARGDIKSAIGLQTEAERRRLTQAAEREKEIKDRATWLGHAAQTLSRIPLMEGSEDPYVQRKQAFAQAVAPTMKAMGVADEAIAQLANAELSDTNLNAFVGALGQKLRDLQIVEADGGIFAVDKNTGDIETLEPKAPKENKGAAPRWAERTLADGRTEWFLLPGTDGYEPGQIAGPGAPSPGATQSSSAPAPTGGVYDQIASIATEAGAAPEEVGYLRRLAQVESNANPKAKNGSSTGVFQFQPETFRSVGGGDLNSVGDQTAAALRLARQDRQKLQQLGIEPTDANLYIMHQQGAGGGPALLTAPPETNAVAALTPAYGGDAAMARRAIVGNGGRADMTAGEFVSYWRNRWAGQQARAAGGPTPSGSPTIQGSAPKANDRWRSATAEEKRAVGIDPETPAQISPQGKVEVSSGQESKITGEQRQAASFTYRALQGNERMNALARQGIYKPDTVTSQLFQNKGGLTQIVARTDKDRAFIQASKEFLAPILRKDSGAAVTDGELAVYMDIYIPRYEDSPSVMWQKAQARHAAMRGLYGTASHAYNKEYGDPGTWQVLTDSRGRPGGKQITTPAGKVTVRPVP